MNFNYLLRLVLAWCSVSALLASTHPARGVTFDDGGLYRVDSVEPYLWVYDSPEGVPTTVDVGPGGEIQNGARLYGSSRLNLLEGGYVNWLSTFDQSVVSIAGGYVGEIAAGGKSVVNLGGGTVGSLEMTSSRATLNIFGTDLTFSGESGNRVSGTLWDGSPIDAEVVSSTRRIVFNPPPESWQNPVSPLDVDHDAVIAPIDSLLIINDLNAWGSRPLPAPPSETPPAFSDVNGDGYVSPIDSLLIINALNARAGTSGTSAVNLRPVPEPAAWVLLSVGALGWLLCLRRPLRHAASRRPTDLRRKSRPSTEKRRQRSQHLAETQTTLAVRDFGLTPGVEWPGTTLVPDPPRAGPDAP